jgi:hypothetical protein
MVVDITKCSRNMEVITAGMELMKDGTKSCFKEITVVIKIDIKVEWTMILGFRGATIKSSSMGAVGSHLTMAVIITVIAVCSISEIEWSTMDPVLSTLLPR